MVVMGNAAVDGQHTRGSRNGIYRISYGENIGEIKPYASAIFSFSGWKTELGGIDCSRCQTVSLRMRGPQGGEQPNSYLDDGNFRWGVDIEEYTNVTSERVAGRFNTAERVRRVWG